MQFFLPPSPSDRHSPTRKVSTRGGDQEAFLFISFNHQLLVGAQICCRKNENHHQETTTSGLGVFLVMIESQFCVCCRDAKRMKDHHLLDLGILLSDDADLLLLSRRLFLSTPFTVGVGIWDSEIDLKRPSGIIIRRSCRYSQKGIKPVAHFILCLTARVAQRLGNPCRRLSSSSRRLFSLLPSKNTPGVGNC